MALAASVGLLAGTGAAGDDDFRKREKKVEGTLAGTWAVVSAERGGKAIDKSLKLTKWVVTDTTLKARLPGEGRGEFAYKLGVAGKRGTIDIEVLRAERDGGPKKRVYQGIYSLEGNTLKVCYAPAAAGRPKDFVTKAGSADTLFVLKREVPGTVAKRFGR